MIEIPIEHIVVSVIFDHARRRMSQLEGEERKLNVLLDAAKELDENRTTRKPNPGEADEIMTLLGSAMTETESVEQVLDVLERAVLKMDEVSASPS